ncbi:MAG: response regulator [Candidatus Helarchaeota archaeon]
MRLLIIDDDETFLDKMKKVLSFDNYSIITCLSGIEALSILKEREFDLIFVDLKMPGLSGIELIQKIRELSSAFIIVITGYGTIESAVKAIKSGAYEYLLKPFDYEELRKKIKEVKGEIEFREKIRFSKAQENLKEKQFIRLSDLDKYNSPFLIISHENPKLLIEAFQLRDSSTIWLDYGKEQNTISPTQLFNLKSKIEEFVKKKKEGTIIFEGIEELIQVHNWEDFKQFLYYVQSEVISSDFTFLILLRQKKYRKSYPYSALLNDALSIIIDPIFNKIIMLLSHPIRKGVIQLLTVEKQMNFNKIVKRLKVDRSSILAFHMNKLLQESIVQKKKNAYFLSPRGQYLADLISILERLGFSDPLSQVKVYTWEKA